MLAPSKDYQGLIGLDGEPMDFNTPRLWTGLLCRSGKEQDAADWMKNAMLFAYWPCYGRDDKSGAMVNGRMGRRPRLCALIPGYIFIAIRAGSTVNPWHVVSQTPGVTSYVRQHDGYPATIQEKDINVIRLIESGQYPPKSAKPEAHTFKVGDKVKFIDSKRAGWPMGVVIKLADDGRIIVEVAMLGRMVPVKVLPHQIETKGIALTKR